MNLSLPLAALLGLLGLGLVAWHARSWRVDGRQLPDESRSAARERRFAERRFRRRTQASLLIAVVGAIIAGAEWIVSPAGRLIAWLIALLVVLWILMLAAADAFASRQHFGAEQSAQDAELLLLQRKLHEQTNDPRRPAAQRPNGRLPSSDAGAE